MKNKIFFERWNKYVNKVFYERRNEEPSISMLKVLVEVGRELRMVNLNRTIGLNEISKKNIAQLGRVL